MKTNFTLIKTFLLTSSLCLIVITKSWSADYYWVGGSGNWTEYATHWATSSGGSTFHTNEPTTSDNVYFDVNSGGNGIVVQANTVFLYCRNLDFSQALSGITFSLSSSITCNGSIILREGMSFYHNSGSVVFRGTNNSTLTSAGASFNHITIDTDGSLTLQDELVVDDVEIMKGTFNSGSHNITTDVSFIMNYYNNDISVDLGSSILYTYDWSVQGTSSNTATLSAANSTIYLTNDAYRFEGDDRTYGKVVVFDVSSTFDLEGNNSISELEINGGNTVEFESGSTQSISTITLNSSAGFPIVLKSSSTSAQATIDLGQSTCGEYLEVGYLSVIGGTATAGTGSVNNGSNSGWTFSGTDCGTVASTFDNEKLNISLYPMPVTSQLHLDYSGSEKVWQLNNSLGMPLQEGSQKNIEMDNLASGVYYLRMEDQVFEIIKE